MRRALIACSFIVLLSIAIGVAQIRTLFGGNPGVTYSTRDMLIDFEGGTNGATPGSTNMSQSIRGQQGAYTASFSSAGANLLFATGQLQTLPSPVSVQGGVWNGLGGLVLQCTTTTSATACGSIEIQPMTNATGAALSLGFSATWTCPNAVTDCGNISGLYSSSGTNYTGAHIKSGLLYLEGAGTIQLSTGTVAVSPSTTYRINMLLNQGPSATDYMTVCDANNNFLGTMTVTSPSGTSFVGNSINLGFQGEEPTTAGYVYNWDNYAVKFDGTFSTSACLL